ncbi:MAG: hypothetical protein J0L84_14885 [Verrucomicrobia bacterium]|nr:hypothetical protein [Verrucomicrobiota bacterium]
MRTSLLLVLGVATALIAGCSRPEAPSELRWRFAGSTALQTQTNAPVLAECLSLPQAHAVLGPLSQRLAQTWWHVGTGGKPSTAADLAAGAALIPDLLQHESLGAVLLQPTGGHEFAVAIRGLGAGAAPWEARWKTGARAVHVARGAGGEPASAHQEDWLVVVSDAAALPPSKAWSQLNTLGAEPGALAQFDVRYPGRVSVKAAMTVRDGAARWTATATVAKPLPATLPAWEIPGAVREPLVFFTAARGLPALLPSLPWLQTWAGRIVPSQVFLWGQPGKPDWGHSYAAARLADPAAAVEELYRRLNPLFATNGTAPFRGYLNLDSKAHRLVIGGGIPAVPTFEAQTEGDKKYLTFGFLPAMRATNSLAPEMLAQLNRPNLAYYDWEFTSAAAHHWHLGGQLLDLTAGRHAVITTPATQWLLAAAPKLGECVTEGLVTSPDTLTLRRKSPLGLTGFEMALLAKWIDPEPPLRRILPPPTNAPAARRKP